MRLDSFDLNLLVAFEVLLEERSVTRAAARLNVTQPAMSASLKKLRESFQDELLVQQGKQMYPTQRALSLLPEVSEALIRLRGLISGGTAFDPKTSKRCFKIIGSDYISTVLLAPLIRSLQDEGPGIEIDLIMPTANSSAMIASGQADLLISPAEFMIGDHPKELIFEERLVVVGCSSNPALKDQVTMEQFMQAGHVAVRVDGRRSFMEKVLGSTAPDRSVEVTAQGFIQVPWLLQNTQRLAVMHERLAIACAKPFNLRICEPPFELKPMREMMMYHGTRARDEGLSWLRKKILAAAIPVEATMPNES